MNNIAELQSQEMELENPNVVTIEAPEGHQYTDPGHQIVGKTIYCIPEVKDSFILVTDEEAAVIAEEIAERFKNDRPKIEE